MGWAETCLAGMTLSQTVAPQWKRRDSPFYEGSNGAFKGGSPFDQQLPPDFPDKVLADAETFGLCR